MSALPDLDALAASHAPPGSSLYYAALFLAPRRRAAVIALAALVDALRALNVHGGDPAVLRPRLAWWADEVSACAAGHPRHPATRVLAAVGGPGITPALAAMHAAAAEAAIGGFADQGALDRFCAGVAGEAAALEARLLGADGDDGPARALGAATELAAVLRAGAGRGLELYWMIPADLRRRHGVTPEHWSVRPTPAAVADLARDQAAIARSALVAALAAREGPGETALRARARMALARLRVLERARYRVLDRRLGVTPLRKLWIAWRAAGMPAGPAREDDAHDPE